MSIVKSPVPVIAPVTSIPAPTFKFCATVVVPSDAIVSLSAPLLVVSSIRKEPPSTVILKSESAFASVKLICGELFTIVTSPDVKTFPRKVNKPHLSIVNLVVGELAPSAVVLNTKRPGISLLPGVPSTNAEIDAAWDSKSVPSAPANLITPNSSLA